MTPALKFMIAEHRAIERRTPEQDRTYVDGVIYEVIKDIRSKYVQAMSECGVGLVGTIGRVEQRVEALIRADYAP